MQERLVLWSLYDILTRGLRVCLLVLGELIHNGAISGSGSQICFRVQAPSRAETDLGRGSF